MDSKKNEVKKTLKERFVSSMKLYIETYIGSIPKTMEGLKENLPNFLLTIAKSIGCIALGILFGTKTFFYSSLPFGTALLSASNKNVSFIYIGLLISACLEKTGLALPLFLIYTALYVSRILVHRTLNAEEKSFELFHEKLKFKIIEGVSASIFISFYRAAYFGFLYFDLLGGLLEILTVPLFIFLFDLGLDKKHKFDIKREIGCISLIAATIFTLIDRYLLGFSLSIIATILISFYISKTAGALRGGVYGLVCGFLSNTALSPVFAINGITSGLLWGVGNASAITISCILSIMCGLYIEGFDALISFAPEILLSSIVFMPLVHFKLLPKVDIYSAIDIHTDNEDAMLFLAERKRQATEEHIEELSKSFSELSEVFYRLSDKNMRPKLLDTHEICDSIRENYCPKCIFKRTCWEKENSSTRNVFSNISKTLIEKGYVEKDDVENYMLERCMHMDRMLERINDAHACKLESMIKENKTEVFAMDYESMAHLLEAAVKINCTDFLPDENMRAKLSEACRKIKLHARNICVYGKRRLSIIASGIDIKNMKLSASEIKKCFENIAQVSLSDPKFEIDGDYITLSLCSDRRFVVECAAASNTKQNETMCGDTICMFENKNDYFYSLISDGMGSGREAALTSRLSSLFLKKMLMAKNSKPVAIEMLNNFIRSKNTECFSTVDLLEIDLLNGQAAFIKSGAASSYVLRNDKIFRISSNTMPVGITREINAEEVKFELENNDVIVMVSDGVGQSNEDLVRVSNILTFDYTENLQTLADKILNDAVRKANRSDDITVGIIRVKEKKT